MEMCVASSLMNEIEHTYPNVREHIEKQVRGRAPQAIKEKVAEYKNAQSEFAKATKAAEKLEAASEALDKSAAELQKEMAKCQGPFKVSLSKVMDAEKVVPNVYFNESLNGEAINRIYKSSQSIKAFAGVLSPKGFECAGGEVKVFGSTELVQKFVDLFSAFKGCRDLYRVTRALCGHEIEAMEGHINTLAKVHGKSICTAFPHSIYHPQIIGGKSL